MLVRFAHIKLWKMLIRHCQVAGKVGVAASSREDSPNATEKKKRCAGGGGGEKEGGGRERGSWERGRRRGRFRTNA